MLIFAIINYEKWKIKLNSLENKENELNVKLDEL